MYRNNSYYEKYGYVVNTNIDKNILNIKLSNLDNTEILYSKVFKLNGYYSDQLDDIVDDCIFMYEKKLK